MTDNPYQAPETPTEVVGVLSGSRDDLRAVAKYQKGILVCILIYFVTGIAQLTAPMTAGLQQLSVLGLLVIVLVGAVFVVLLSIKVYGMVSGLLMGFLTLIPLIGLLVLLMINQKATSILKTNGIKVGLLGAKLSAI